MLSLFNFRGRIAKRVRPTMVQEADDQDMNSFRSGRVPASSQHAAI